jgi:hypothetical protein
MLLNVEPEVQYIFCTLALEEKASILWRIISNIS